MSTTMKNIDATAADSFHENDLEIGAAPTAGVSYSYEHPAPSNNNSGRKNRIGWFIAGTVAFLIILGLSVGLTTKNNGDGPSTVVAEAGNVAETSSVAIGTTTTTTTIAPSANNDNADPTSSGSDGISAPNPFDPEVEIGDSLLTWTDQVFDNSTSPTLSPVTETVITTASPTLSPVTETVTSELNEVPTTTGSLISDTPTVSPSRKPITMEPTNSPSNEPTLQPTTSPSQSPTPQPSTPPTQKPTTSQPTQEPTPQPSKAPSQSPTKKPVFTLDLSGWGDMNWNFDPTISPSVPPTSKPTNLPTTRQPTSQPSNLPTSQPTNVPTPKPTEAPITPSPTVYQPFFFGDEFIRDDELDIDISRGLSVRVIAQTGQKVPYANGDESDKNYHTRSDAAGIIPMDPNNPTESGYVYVVNSEEEDGGGGVYGIYFDKGGNVLEYKALLTKTTDNCGGGHTPWNTWVSCEEFEDGQCWQIDPVNERVAETKLGGSGGRYESVAVDNRNPNAPIFFTTEDHERGALRRFLASGSGWDALHTDGETTFLNILDDSTFEWTDDEDEGRDSAERYFRNTEGIQVHEGKLYFMAKKDFKMLILDLDNMTYTTETTGKKFYGEGSFENQPDQNLFGPTRKYIYFTEDGGETPGVFARYGSDGTYFTLFQAVKGGRYGEDETVGIALSPDHKRFYAGIQDFGVIFEFTRDDGLPFE